jgi:uncharacterized protein (DUF2141 family)
MPLDIAVGKNTSIGAIKGTVFDADNDNAPLADVIILMNGKATMTDKSGRFTIANISPGKYALNIDRRTIGVRKVTSCQMPLEVTVSGGEITSVEIGVMEGCRLAGKLIPSVSAAKFEKKIDDEVSLAGIEEFKRNTEANKLSNIVVELEQNGEVVRRITSKGEYQFLGLKPGKYSYRIYRDNLPENADFAEPEGTIELRSGQDKQLDFKVVPRMKSIEFIDEGEVDVISG